MSGLNTQGVVQVNPTNFPNGYAGGVAIDQMDYPQANGATPQQIAVPAVYADAITPVALTYASTITPDASQSRTFSCLLTGNVTLANPANLIPGQSITVILTQDATGSRLLSAVGSLWKFPGGTKTLSTAANAVDVIKGTYDGTRIIGSIALALA